MGVIAANARSSENVVLEIATSYRKTAALIAAVKLNIFTLIGSVR